MNCRNSPKKAPKLTVSLPWRHLISMAENKGLTSLPGLTAPNCSWNLPHPRMNDTLKHLFMVHLSKEHGQFLLSIDFDPVSQITCANRHGFLSPGGTGTIDQEGAFSRKVDSWYGSSPPLPEVDDWCLEIVGTRTPDT